MDYSALKIPDPTRSVLIAYGSETGNAYDYAEELGRVFERIHFWAHVSSLDYVETASIDATCARLTRDRLMIHSLH